MDLRSISGNQITIWAALAAGLAVALVIGSAVGNADTRFVAGVLAVIPVVVIFSKLKTNIWVLLPIGWYLTGRLSWLPLPFTLRDLCFLAVFGAFTLLVATRAVSLKRRLNTLDYLIYINLAYLATVYVRNPAGFWAMQTSIVGGRPYFEIILAFGAFIILSRVQITDLVAKIFPLFFVIPTWSLAILDVVARLVPQAAIPLAMMYSGVGSGIGGTIGSIQQEQRLGETRMTGMMFAGLTSILALVAKYNPITIISPLYPFRVMLLCLAFGAIFLSGYRSTFLFAIVAFFLSAVLRGNVKELCIAGTGMLLSLIVLVSVQGTLVQLPMTVQRTLSWLPGDWNQEAITDAEGSTQWRVEMWVWAWNDDKILKDRIWGQGFGLTFDDMSLIASSMMAGQGGGSLLGGSDREQFMITGSFHNGPLSAIKYVGVVGLVLYYPMMCYMAWLAWRICKRARGTKAFTLALFVGIPIIYEPFNFVFIFGGIDGNYSQLLFWAGLLKMLENYLHTIKASPVIAAKQHGGSSRDPETASAAGVASLRLSDTNALEHSRYSR